jgi:hypothetical protein
MEHAVGFGLSLLVQSKRLDQDWWLLRMFVDYSQGKHIASWNAAIGVWQTNQVNLLCGHSGLFSATWPASGMTLGGQAYELAKPVHPTTVSESLSSPTLPTPVAQDGSGAMHPDDRAKSGAGYGPALRDISYLMPVPDESLLRSPKASEGQGGALGEAEALRRGNTVGVRDQVMDLVASQGLQVTRQELNEPVQVLPTVLANGPMRNSRRAMVTHPTKRSSVGLNQAIEIASGVLPREFESWDEVPASLLPTPNTMEHREIKTPEQIAELKKRSPGGYRNLRESVVNDLMPTPTARDYKDGQADHERDGVVQTDTVARAIFSSGEISPTEWGKFEPAIRRWESVLKRPAPAPTNPDGKDGNHRLSARFTEWMMGLPEGWVTDPSMGLSRNEQLKLCGNGVVPQQAELALRILLDGLVL